MSGGSVCAPVAHSNLCGIGLRLFVGARPVSSFIHCHFGRLVTCGVLKQDVYYFSTGLREFDHAFMFILR